MATPITGKEKTKSQSKSQTVGIYGGGPCELQRGSSASKASYSTYRKMRKDPTIALARWLSSAPIVSSAWSVEAKENAPDGAQKFIDAQLQPLRLHLLRNTMLGQIDFGWQPYEKVLGLTREGMIGVAKLKPLLQDSTQILVDEQTGAYAGLKNYDTTLSIEDTLLFSFEPEGGDLYGSPILENVRDPWDKSNALEKASSRYDDKIAGTHLVVHYPPGKSEVNGVEVPNDEIADMIIKQWQSSGTVKVPRRVSDVLPEMSGTPIDAWEIELLTDSSSGRGAFTERANYLDARKVRGFGLPERAVLEGQYGTKAEAETHGDIAITCMELRHQDIAQTINWHLVNHLLRLNYGEQFENSVSIVPAPINDAGKAFLRDVYKTALANESFFLLETEDIDMPALRERIGVPTKSVIVDPTEQPVIVPPAGSNPALPGNSLPTAAPTATVTPPA